MSKSVKLKFAASIAKKMGKDEIDFTVEEDFSKAVSQIRKYVQDEIGQSVLFTLLHNDRSYALAQKEKVDVKDGDIFTIVPTVLGG